LPPPTPPDLIIAAIALFVAVAIRSPATLVAIAIALLPLPSPLPASHPHRHHHHPCCPCPCPLCCPPALSPSPSPMLLPLPLPLPSPSPSLPLLAHHPRCHHSCSQHHCPLCCTPPSSQMLSFLSLPLLSLSPATLIAATIALSTLTLFVAAINIRRMLSSFVAAHCRGCVVALSTLSCQSPATARLCGSPCCLIVVPLLSPSPLLLSLALQPRLHCSCCRRHHPLCHMPPLLPMPWPMLPLPSLSTSNLMAVTIALAILALFVAAITIRHTLLLFIVAHHRGCVVALLTPSSLLPTAARLHCSRRWLIVMIIQRFQTQGIHQRGGQGGHIEEPVKSALLSAGRCVHGEPTGEPTCGYLMVGEAGTRMSLSFKWWHLHHQPLPIVVVLGNGWLLCPLLSRISSSTTSS
jgi:hypothetical protein